ncbi:RluA family pseudouridine synthase [Fredinandcohnia quinoae]|uniref:Pseudouridine synthase n=1 Tax=Fredinandcohnia quinoae TaxID=2918902 RepID=A0AAW5EEP2_9BACI|nr:RluA family pseudouridine synthase [Fredinandcohnia sp. SECRCQ15]
MLTDKKGEWLEVTIPKDWNGYTIEHILKEIWQVPRLLLHQYRMDKSVTLNGHAITWNTNVVTHDKFQLHLFQPEDFDVEPEYIDLHILYEDDHLLVVNKPAGMDTHPNDQGQQGTLANAVAFHFQSTGVNAKVRHIHRLDRDTTGAVLFAKNKLAGAIMDRRLENREIKRTYHALVHGILKQKSGKIDAAIGRDRHHPTRRRVSPSGQKAITNYKVIQTLTSQNMTLVELELQTGRTHQIRVHMSYLGYPLIGDTLYGGKPIVPRQALHAAKLKLQHPITNEIIICEAPFLDHPDIFHFSN